MIHGVADNAGYFGRIAAELMPDVDVVHFVDGAIPSMAAPELRPRVIHRLKTLASFAEESGAEAVLLTCTAFGRLVDDVKGAVACPVLSVLEVMVEEALKMSGTIGVLGSHHGTLAAASALLTEQASLLGRSVTVITRFCPGAFDAVQRDDWATHNRIVLYGLRQLVEQVDVVVAPQPSVERVMTQYNSSESRVPILTSPRVSVLRLREALG